MIETFGIPDYDPEEYASTEEIAREVGGTLTGFTGQSFDSAWLMWDFAADEWVSDAPALFCLGRSQLEICFGDRQEMYATVDRIDRSRPIAWFDDKNRPYRWLQNPEREFSSLAFRRLARVGIGERGWTTGGVLTFQPSSIEFDFGDAHLAIERFEDGNGLRFSPPEIDAGHRVRWLG